MTTPESTRPAPPLWERLAWRVASRFGAAARRGTRVPRSNEERASKEDRDRERVERRVEHAEAKRLREDARETRRREEAARHDQARLDLERALDAAYANYRRVRDWALHVRGAGGGHLPLDDRDRQTAAALAPLWDADRATIANLRHWSDPLRGPQPSEATAAPEPGEQLRRRVTLLRKWQLGHVLVPEVATLGKSGFMIGNERHSEESLRFALGAAALAEGGVLSAFRKPSDRGLVWEIGGGWGGFAYLFKTLCPNVTYLITGPLERLLVSASYVMSVCPGARCRFHGEPGTGDTWADWGNVDFVFAPESCLADLSPPRLDLTVDIDELRGTAPARQAALVQRAHEWGSRYFYSMLPALAVDDPAAPWDLIARFYWPHPISLRTERSRVYRRLSPPEHEAVHLIGWKRMCL